MEGYVLKTNEFFEKRYRKLFAKNKKIASEVLRVFLILSRDPFDLRLRTHAVISKNFGRKWSSSVNKDLRIIWEFESGEIRVLLILDIGGHSGGKRVY